MAVTQLLHPEADSGPIRHGEEASLKSCLLRQIAVVLCISYVWVKAFASRDRLYNSGELRGISAAIQRSYIYVCFVFLLSKNHWLPLRSESLAWSIIVLFFFA